jgi:pimeloyl-ACP methyl ester carboxylesterase
VAALSVPYAPPGSVRPTVGLKQLAGDAFMYMLYFQSPGVAETELEADVRTTLRRFYYTLSGDAPPEHWWRVLPRTARLLEATVDPERLPGWLTEADLEYYTAEFARTGFRGGLNWYRTLDLSWELMAAWRRAPITTPALFVAGDRDLVIVRRAADLDRLAKLVPQLRTRIILPGCGHWTQQERPAEVNAELLAFLGSLGG